jgi:hypothetical protein
MPSEDRNEVRELAQAQIDRHRARPLVSVLGEVGCRCAECKQANAILSLTSAKDRAISRRVTP